MSDCQELGGWDRNEEELLATRGFLWGVGGKDWLYNLINILEST